MEGSLGIKVIEIKVKCIGLPCAIVVGMVITPKFGSLESDGVGHGRFFVY